MKLYEVTQRYFNRADAACGKDKTIGWVVAETEAAATAAIDPGSLLHPDWLAHDPVVREIGELDPAATGPTFLHAR